MKTRDFLRLLFFAISPLVVILLFVGLIAFADRYFEHKNEVDRLLETGRELTCIIVSNNPDKDDDIIAVLLPGKDEDQIYGFIETRFLPESFKKELKKGMSLRILYSDYDSNAVPAETLNHYKNSINHLLGSFFIIIFAVIYLAIDPRILLLGTESWQSGKGLPK